MQTHDIHKEVGGLQAEVKNLIRMIGALEEQVMGLRDDLNQRKGARQTLLFLCGCIGTIGGMIGATIKSLMGN